MNNKNKKMYISYWNRLLEDTKDWSSTKCIPENIRRTIFDSVYNYMTAIGDFHYENFLDVYIDQIAMYYRDQIAMETK